MSETLIYSNLAYEFSKLLSKTGEIFLVSPFTNLAAIQNLLEHCASEERVTLVTRWRLDDISAGVSDVEVYPFLQKLNGRLYINNRLHAKFYRKGNSGLIGSANLTHNGFSIGRVGNIELLTQVALEIDKCLEFENMLIEDSILVDDALYSKMSTLQRELRQSLQDLESPSEISANESSLKYWWPETRNPESLWENYLENRDVIVARDLDRLSLPSGIKNEETFKKIVLAALELHPNVQEVINFVGLSERRFGEMRQQLRVIDPEIFDTTLSWQALFRWLVFLDPERFEYFRPNFSEMIRLKKP
jgi:hypothetical protein